MCPPENHPSPNLHCMAISLWTPDHHTRVFLPQTVATKLDAHN